MNQLVKGFLFAVLALSTLLACEPKDENVKRPYVNPFAQAKVERAQITGLDYLQYTAYRLNEVKQLVEFVSNSQNPAARAKETNPCGRVVVDKVEGSRRMLRLQTRGCELGTGNVANLSLTADGEELIDVQLDNQGQATRILSTTVGPYLINGKIGGKSEMKESTINARERRELAVDLLRSENGVQLYRFTYAVELKWRQELVTPSFKAFEDNGLNFLNLSGEFSLQNGVAQSVTVDFARLTAAVPREVSERKRKNKNAPAKTFHNMNLVMAAVEDADKGTLVPLLLSPKQCGLPLGKLVVTNYSNSTTDKEDKLTSQKEKGVEFTALGIRSLLSGKITLWTDCRPALSFPLPGGGDGGWTGEVPPAQAGELGNRTPYTALFFK